MSGTSDTLPVPPGPGMRRRGAFQGGQVVNVPDEVAAVFAARRSQPPGERAELVGRGLRRRDAGDRRDLGRIAPRPGHERAHRPPLRSQRRRGQRHLEPDPAAQRRRGNECRRVFDLAAEEPAPVADRDVGVVERPHLVGPDRPEDRRPEAAADIAAHTGYVGEIRHRQQ